MDDQTPALGDHRVALDTYDEPGVQWSFAVCACAWEGPFRSQREQACIDAARHLHDPGRGLYGDDWNVKVGEARRRIYAIFRPVFDNTYDSLRDGR